jgi:hypothetical protein
MSQFLNQVKPEPISGMDLMGHPIGCDRRQRAYEHAKAIGLSPDDAEACVSGMVQAYQRDKPYEAQEHSMKFVDLTGHYRLMAAILA